MAKLLKLRRGTTSEHSSFTGAEGEVTVDTTKDSLVVHDGSTAGGHPIAKSSDIISTVDKIIEGDTSIEATDADVAGSGTSGIEAKTTGAQIVKSTCVKPFNQILVNAGYEEVKGQILADQLINSGNDVWAGYNIKTGTTTDMKKAGIIDPTKVVRLALENAASVAGTVLLTECTVVNELEEDNNKNQPQIDPSMMGMM